LLDLFSGRWGWSRAFAAHGWDVVGVDMERPSEIPEGCTFIQADVLNMHGGNGAFFFPGLEDDNYVVEPDFVVASSPCEQFSIHGMPHFFPNPSYPYWGIKLFNHTREICEAAGRPYVMENVRPAQTFVGNAVHHCGPFYLWGTGVPPIVPQGILKGRRLMKGGYKGQTGIQNDKKAGAIIATIPAELANCVADYAERICEEEPIGKQPVPSSNA